MKITKAEKQLIEATFREHGYNIDTKECTCGSRFNNIAEAEDHGYEEVFKAGKRSAENLKIGK